jgi:hypothetical protein
VLRTISRSLPFAAAAILGAGCGSSQTATVTGTTAASGSISNAQATAFAHEVNLAAADVPGAVVRTTERESAAPSQASVEFARCSGGVDPRRRLVNINSPSFRLRTAGISMRVKSSVEVMPTAALAAHNYAAIRSARGHACLARQLTQILQKTATGPASFEHATVTSLPNLLSTGQESFGVRVTMTLTATVRGKQIRLPVYLDEFDVLAGPAEVNMSASASRHPTPTTTERPLLSLLYSRAQTHKL